jgi:oligopeptide transport system permease protein
MNYVIKARIGLGILAALVLFFILGTLFCPYTPTCTALADKNSAPSLAHWFGTDELGRDLVARTLQGMRISLAIGACAAAIDLFLGTLWGTIAGFAGPRLEYVMMRISELIYSLPYLLVVILVSVFIGTGFLPLIVAMICIGWIQMARVIRVLVKDARHAEYVQAAWALGVRPSRLFFTHIFPNIVGPMGAACMLSVPHAIFTEAFLSFLGIGIQPPTASLGSMVGDAIPAMRFYPWRLFFPACCISMLIFSIMLLTDSLRDLYDPKQRLMGDTAT